MGNFIDRVVQYPGRYKLTLVQGTIDTYDFTPVQGEVSQAGTPLNAVTMSSLDVWDNSTTRILWKATAGANYIDVASGTTDCYINWGDGTAEQKLQTSTTVSVVHDFTTAGYYVITIRGTFAGFKVDNLTGRKEKYIELYIGTNCPIGNNAFNGCTNLENIIFASDWDKTIIGEYAFFNCVKLKEIYLPNSIITISAHAFDFCSKLKKIDFPTELITIGAAAFAHSGLTEAILPSKLTTIGNSAFSNCSNLEKVNIPATFITMGAAADSFQDCSIKYLTVDKSIETVLPDINNNFFRVSRLAGLVITGSASPTQRTNIYTKMIKAGATLYTAITSDNLITVNPIWF